MRYLKNNKIWDTANPKWIVVAEDKSGNSFFAIEDEDNDSMEWNILYYDIYNKVFVRYSSVKRKTDDPTPPRREVIVYDDVSVEGIVNNWEGIVYWEKMENIFK